jgi:hypothetical protein
MLRDVFSGLFELAALGSLLMFIGLVTQTIGMS